MYGEDTNSNSQEKEGKKKNKEKRKESQIVSNRKIAMGGKRWGYRSPHPNIQIPTKQGKDQLGNFRVAQFFF